MVPRFCLSPLPLFNTSLTEESSISENLKLLPIADSPIDLIEEYERRMSEDRYIILPTKYRAELANCTWMLRYEDQLQDADFRLSNIGEAKRAIVLGLVAMQLVQPTLADEDFILSGFVRDLAPQLAEVAGDYSFRKHITEAQRLGLFAASHVALVRELYPKLQAVLDLEGRKRNRIATAIRAYRLASKASQPEPRVILYCASLESLFTTQNQELTLQLKVRISRWLGQTRDEREKLWKSVGEIYSLRSAMAHGGSWQERLRGSNEDERQRNFGELVEQADALVRNTLLKVFRDNLTELFMGGNDPFEAHWKTVCLS
jgi:hypothetical protein